MRMIRTPRYKLVRHHFSNYLDELYDLQEDPGETRNLYQNPKHRATRDTLQERLTQWQRSINDPLLGPLPAQSLFGPLRRAEASLAANIYLED
jgi:arylsulfatase A-like enzyme